MTVSTPTERSQRMRAPFAAGACILAAALLAGCGPSSPDPGASPGAPTSPSASASQTPGAPRSGASGSDAPSPSASASPSAAQTPSARTTTTAAAPAPSDAAQDPVPSAAPRPPAPSQTPVAPMSPAGPDTACVGKAHVYTDLANVSCEQAKRTGDLIAAGSYRTFPGEPGKILVSNSTLCFMDPADLTRPRAGGSECGWFEPGKPGTDVFDGRFTITAR